MSDFSWEVFNVFMLYYMDYCFICVKNKQIIYKIDPSISFLDLSTFKNPANKNNVLLETQ